MKYIIKYLDYTVIYEFLTYEEIKKKKTVKEIMKEIGWIK
jgi:hypothetical protein